MFTYYESDNVIAERFRGGGGWVLLAVHAKANPSLPARDPGRLWTTIQLQVGGGTIVVALKF